MSYPNYFAPHGWREHESDPEIFKTRIAEGTVNESSHVQTEWQAIADRLIEAADLFKEMTDQSVGITHVIMQASVEAAEHYMSLNFRLKQRAYGQTGTVTGPDNWTAIEAKLTEVTTLFTSLFYGYGSLASDYKKVTMNPELSMKFFLKQIYQ